MEPIRILLADPQTLFREGLRALLAGCEEVEVVGEVPQPEEAATLLRLMPADLVLMDVSGEGAVRVRNLETGAKTAFLTDRSDEDALTEYQESGAAGFILKDGGSGELLDAIRRIHGGNTWVSEPIATAIAKRGVRGSGALTPREQEVLKMTAQGHSVKQVATMLDLSAKTVDAHKVNLMRKLRIHNKAQLVQYAFQKQILRVMVGGQGFEPRTPSV